VSKPSRQGGLVSASGSPVLQDAETPERDAKKRRKDRDDPDFVVDDVELSPGMVGRRRSAPQTPPSRRLTRKTSLGSDGVPCSRMSPGPSHSRRVLVRRLKRWVKVHRPVYVVGV
jgi:hypothetical protein